MGNKSQTSLFFIIGLLIIILLIFFLNQKNSTDLSGGELYSEEIVSFQNYFDECALQAIIKSNVLNGFISDNVNYQDLINANVDNCMLPFIEFLQEKGFTIKKSQPYSILEVNAKTLVISIIYPTEISKDSFKFTFREHIKTFERDIEIDLNEIEKDSVFSSDNMARVDFSGKTSLYDIYGNKAEDIMIIKVSDKREKKGDELKGNLIYCILPLENMPNSPTKICLYPEELIPDVEDISKLKISWWNPRSNKWGFLDSEYQNNCLETTLNYTTCFGIVETEETFGELAPGEKYEEDNFYGSLSNSPPPEYEMIPGKYDEIFDKINAEMGGPYQLDPNPSCVLGGPGVYCYVGWVQGCDTGIHCRPDKINSMDETEVNILFRHEITHSLQQKNEGCLKGGGDNEWGAEYYSGSNYYVCPIGTNFFTPSEIGRLMIEKGCSKEEITNAAFCIKGAIQELSNKGCLISKTPASVTDGRCKPR